MNTITTEAIKIEQILSALPQKYPFLFVDKIIELEPEKYIHAQKAVSYNEWFFQGHFPEEPILPGNIIIEIMAQTTGLLLLNKDENTKSHPLRPGNLVQCNVKFLQKVIPGTMLDIKARSNIISDQCLSSNVNVYVGKNKIATGDIIIAFKT